MTFRLGLKRLFDVCVAALALVLLSPVLAVCALVLLAVEGRPVLFRQIRVGRNGREFTMLKFRTMGEDAQDRLPELAPQNERHGPLFTMADDPRVSRVGRFMRTTSLDELPQLVNVLRGEMSLVGPRPALPAEVAEFDPEVRQREQLPQGMTGQWQIKGRRNPDFDTYVQMDLDYVTHWSLHRDLAILMRTPFEIIVHARDSRRARGRRQ